MENVASKISPRSGGSRRLFPFPRAVAQLGRIAASVGLGAAVLGAQADEVQAESAGHASIQVQFVGLRSNHGHLAIGLFQRSEGFPNHKHVLAGKFARINGGHASVAFADLQPGRYAIAVLHDENENNKLDRNWMGLPNEGFGFSNDAQVILGPPSFDDAAFRVTPGASNITIRMRYL